MLVVCVTEWISHCYFIAFAIVVMEKNIQPDSHINMHNAHVGVPKTVGHSFRYCWIEMFGLDMKIDTNIGHYPLSRLHWKEFNWKSSEYSIKPNKCVQLFLSLKPKMKKVYKMQYKAKSVNQWLYIDTNTIHTFNRTHTHTHILPNGTNENRKMPPPANPSHSLNCLKSMILNSFSLCWHVSDIRCFLPDVCR